MSEYTSGQYLAKIATKSKKLNTALAVAKAKTDPAASNVPTKSLKARMKRTKLDHLKSLGELAKAEYLASVAYPGAVAKLAAARDAAYAAKASYERAEGRYRVRTLGIEARTYYAEARSLAQVRNAKRKSETADPFS